MASAQLEQDIVIGGTTVASAGDRIIVMPQVSGSHVAFSDGKTLFEQWSEEMDSIYAALNNAAEAVLSAQETIVKFTTSDHNVSGKINYEKIPNIPTAIAGDSSSKIASTRFVQEAIASRIRSYADVAQEDGQPLDSTINVADVSMSIITSFLAAARMTLMSTKQLLLYAACC